MYLSQYCSNVYELLYTFCKYTYCKVQLLVFFHSKTDEIHFYTHMSVENKIGNPLVWLCVALSSKIGPGLVAVLC